MLMANLFSSRAPHIHIFLQSRNNSACCLVCQRQRKYSSKASSEVNLVNDDTYRWACVTDHNCVILQTKSNMCIKIQRECEEKVSRLLKRHSICFGHCIHTYYHIHYERQHRSHEPCLRMRMQGNKGDLFE